MDLRNIPGSHPGNNSLYIHIPFCQSKCSYCDFYSEPNVSVEIQECVVSGILDEISGYVDVLEINSIETVFIGGGTPSALDAGVFKRLMQGVSERLPHTVREWTIEANPETVTEAFLDTAGEFGCTRLSLGIQSFDDRLLAILGRRAGQKEIFGAIERINKKWKGEVSGDIITGIPSQTQAEANDDITRLLSLRWDHYSMYSLTLEPDTPLFDTIHSGKLEMTPAEILELHWFKTVQLLLGRGYTQYEISNYAKPGFECRHNMRYWTMEPYIGVGPGAVSTLPGKNNTIVRIHNLPSVHGYIQSRQDREKMNHEIVSPKEFLLENLMMGFRLGAGIQKKVFQQRFTVPLDEIVPEMWKTWKKNNMACDADDAWKLTARGRYLLDSLLYEAAEQLRKAGPVKLAFWG
ncbi:MAG: radical SAM family heme chaperone HemW [Spirochaetales bacterium]|nr:radical SAM family heme chaperone HemW [Spirochaetales bacterium]